MKYSYIIMAFSALFTLGLFDNSRGPVYPQALSFFEVSNATGSLVFSVASLSGLISTYYSKLWLAPLGALRATQFALILRIIACVMIYFAPAGFTGFVIFFIASAITGFGMGMEGVSLTLLINSSAPVDKQRQAYSGLHAMYGLASLIAPFGLSWFFHFNLDWQSYFLLVGIFPVIVLLGSLKLNPQGITELKSLNLNMPMGQIFTLGFLTSFYVTAEVLISSRLVTFLTSSHSWKMDESSGSLSLFFLFLLSGRVLFAVKKFPISTINCLRISAISSFIVAVITINFAPAYLCLTGLTMSYFYPCVQELLGKNYGETLDTLISKVMCFVAIVLALAHWVFGVISTNASVYMAMQLSPILLFVIILILFFKLDFLKHK